MNAILRTVATPLSLIVVLGLGITGLLMFFGVKGPLNDLHEWIGIAFLFVLLLHVMRNWKSFLFMLKPWHAKVIIAVVAIALLGVSANLLLSAKGGASHGGPWLVANRIAAAPIATSAPALGLSSEAVVAKLKAKGITVHSAQESLAEVAEEQHVEVVHLFALLLNEH